MKDIPKLPLHIWIQDEKGLLRVSVSILFVAAKETVIWFSGPLEIKKMSIFCLTKYSSSCGRRMTMAKETGDQCCPTCSAGGGPTIKIKIKILFVSHELESPLLENCFHISKMGIRNTLKASHGSADSSLKKTHYPKQY